VIKVTIRYGESSERFFQRFKRLCAKEGVFKEIKRRRYFEKPSDRRRRRTKEAKRAALKEAKRAARALKLRRSPRPTEGRGGGGRH
jgi:small subunit ribosomal protein S21